MFPIKSLDLINLLFFFKEKKILTLKCRIICVLCRIILLHRTKHYFFNRPTPSFMSVAWVLLQGQADRQATEEETFVSSVLRRCSTKTVHFDGWNNLYSITILLYFLSSAGEYYITYPVWLSLLAIHAPFCLLISSPCRKEHPFETSQKLWPFLL